MKRFAAAALLLLAACASNAPNDVPDHDFPAPSRPRAMRAALMLDVVPAGDWWHEPRLQSTLNLSAEQFASLDRIQKEQGAEVEHLDRDVIVASRDLKTLLDSDQPVAADITTAAQRLRAIRDSLFDKQAAMLAAERAVLTRAQWQALQSSLTEERGRREDWMNDRRGGGMRGGRGGFGGAGRRP